MAYQEKIREQLRALRQKRGPQVAQAAARLKEGNRIRKALLDCLGRGEKNVLELAAETRLDPAVVFWHVNALRKYGGIRDGVKRGDYFTYRAEPPGKAGS